MSFSPSVYPVCPLEKLLEMKVYQFVPFVPPEEENIFLDAMPGCTHTRWHPLARAEEDLDPPRSQGGQVLPHPVG